MTDLEQIKEKIDIVSYISEYVALKKTGANFKGLCPFHLEKTPSFIVSPERQIWHCFGGCQDGGDIFKFLMRVENLEFPEALKILAKRAGVSLTSYQPSKTGELKERIYSANHLASEFYNYILAKHPLGGKAREYLEGRQITNNSITLFSLGYAPNSWSSLTTFLLKKGYNRSELEAAGLVSKSGIGNYFDRFRGRLIFSLLDHRGNVVGFAGRLLDPEAQEAKYVNTAETLAYTKGEVLYGLNITKEEIKKAGFAVAVEGEIDAIQSYQAGVRNVVAIKGSALTTGHVNLLKRYTENVYLSLDSDFAGDAAAHRGIEIADAAGLNIRVVSFNEAKDPDELIKTVGPASWHQAVEQAVPFYDFIITSALAKHDPKTSEGSKAIVTEVAKFIAPIDNLVVQNHYLKDLSSKLDVPVDILQTQLAKEYKQSLRSSPSTALGAAGLKKVEAITNSPRSRGEAIEEYLLALLLQSRNPSDYLLLISPRLSSQNFSNPIYAQIYQTLVDYPAKNLQIQQFVKIVPPELVDSVDRLYLLETKEDPLDDATVLEEVQKTAWELKELSLRDELRRISLALKHDPDSTQLEDSFAQTTLSLQKLLEEKQLLAKKPLTQITK